MVKVVNKLRHYSVVEIEGKTFNIENEVAYKYQINNGSTIDSNKLKEILLDNEFYYYDRIAKNKLKNPMSEKMMREFLSKQGAKKAIIDKLIENYLSFNYINDNDYISSYINYSEKREGPKVILLKLKSKGINEDLIKEQIANIDEESIIEDIVNNQIRKKINKNKNEFSSSLKSNLISKGYSTNVVFEVVDRLLNSIEIDEYLLAEKEYFKLLKKYQDKKDSKELSYFIKSKLYQKGFNQDIINKLFIKLEEEI